MIIKYKKENVEISDYSVQITDLPQQDVSENKIRESFGKYGEIHEIALGDAHRKFLRQCKKLSEITIKQVSEERRLSSDIVQGKCFSFVEFCSRILTCKCNQRGQKYLQKLEEEKKKLQKEILDNLAQWNEENEVCKVFIIFEQVEAKMKCLKDYQTKKLFTKKQPDSIKQNQTYSIKVKEANDPSLIIWENLQVKSMERNTCSYLATFTSIAVVGISLILVWAINQSQNENFPSQSDCT